MSLSLSRMSTGSHPPPPSPTAAWFPASGGTAYPVHRFARGSQIPRAVQGLPHSGGGPADRRTGTDRDVAERASRTSLHSLRASLWGIYLSWNWASRAMPATRAGRCSRTSLGRSARGRAWRSGRGGPRGHLVQPSSESRRGRDLHGSGSEGWAQSSPPVLVLAQMVSGCNDCPLGKVEPQPDPRHSDDDGIGSFPQSRLEFPQ